MSVDKSLQNKKNTATGVVLVVFRDPDVPVDTDAVIERTTTSASLPDPSNWSEIGILENCDVSGTPFIDYLPMNDEVFWYRAKHAADGYEDSEYIFETSGSAQLIPDVDWSKKPWLLSDIPLQLDMVITSHSISEWVVSSSVNQPVHGGSGPKPTIGIYATGNVGPITSASVSGNWFIARPDVTSDLPSFVTFQSTLQGYLPGRDRVQLTPLGEFELDDALTLLLTVSASDANSIGISGSVIGNHDSVPLWYGVYESSNVGSITQDDVSSFTIQRPSTGLGSVNFYVTSSDVDTISDYDTIFIQADSDLSADQFLGLQLTLVSSHVSGVLVSGSANNSGGYPIGYAVVDSNNVGAITRTGVSSFQVLRPTSGEGTVVFAVTSSNSSVVSDYDTFYISKDPLPYLTVRSQVTSANFLGVTASVEVRDSNNTTTTLSGITMTPTLPSLTGFNASQFSNSQTTGVNTYTYHITRPAYLQGTGRVTFTATKTGYTQDSDSVEVPERVENLANLICRASITSLTTSSVGVNVTATDPLGLGTPTISASLHPGGVAGASIGGSSPNWTIQRPSFGAGNIQARFTATQTGRIMDVDSVEVAERTDGLGTLQLSLTPTSTSTTQMVVSASAVDNAGSGAGISYSASVHPGGKFTYTGTNPYTITRPSAGSGNGTLTVTATKGTLKDRESVTVQDQVSGGGGGGSDPVLYSCTVSRFGSFQAKLRAKFTIPPQGLGGSFVLEWRDEASSGAFSSLNSWIVTYTEHSPNDHEWLFDAPGSGDENDIDDSDIRFSVSGVTVTNSPQILQPPY